MSAYSQIFTKATDFVGSVSGSVDPRTGQYTIALHLGSLIANNGLGPHIPLVLKYSPLTQSNIGFGVGFGFGFTTYDQRSTLLSLSSGTHYKVLENSESLTLIDAKIKEVSVTKQKDKYYKVAYKDGNFELLTSPNTMSSMKVPYKIVSNSGHFVSLNWEFVDNQFRLLSIVDENGVALVKINYPNFQNAATTIAVLPDRQLDTKNTDDPEGYNVCLLFNDNHHLSKIVCDAAEGLEWQIGYTNLDGLGPWGQIASSLTHPGGLYEYAEYSKSKGHRFPNTRSDMGSSLYPYVTDFTRVPGCGQPVTTLHYNYDIINNHNFLGYAAPGTYARNPTVDALFNCSDASYRYHTQENHVDSSGVLTRIERTYNCFHQLTEQKITTNNCSISRCSDYYSTPGMGFNAQPPNFECPKQITQILSRIDPLTGSKKQIEAVETSTYDDFGNILEKLASFTDASGVTTPAGTVSYQYYPSDVDTAYDANTGYGCPKDANSYNRYNKIPRFLKSKTVTPHVFAGDEQPAQTRYSYTSYPMPDAVTQLLAPSDPDVTALCSVFKTEQRSYHADTLLQKSVYTYADRGSVLIGSIPGFSEFGCPTKTVDTHYPNDGLKYDSTDPRTAEAFSTTHTTVRELEGSLLDCLKDTSTVTTWDNLTTSSSQTCSRFTGFIKEQVNSLGVKGQATYDVLGRVLSVTTAVDTQYAGTRRFSYEISSSGMVGTATDSLGNQARVTSNGVGKPIKGEAKLNGASSLWQLMASKNYDNAGRLLEHTLYDYLENTDSKPFSSVTSTNHYDSWGRIDCVTTLDGIKHYSISDPILGCRTTYSESAGSDPFQTSKVVSTINPANATLTTALFASDNLSTVPNSTKSQTYDGWKQLRATTDELKRSSTFTYDIFGRSSVTTICPVKLQDSIIIDYPVEGNSITLPMYDPWSTSQDSPITVTGTALPGAFLNLYTDGTPLEKPFEVSDTGIWAQTVYIYAPSIGSTSHTVRAEDVSNPHDSVSVNFNTYRGHYIG